VQPVRVDEVGVGAGSAQGGDGTGVAAARHGDVVRAGAGEVV